MIAGVPHQHPSTSPLAEKPRFVQMETLRHPGYPDLLHVVLEATDGVRGVGETCWAAEAVEAYLHEIVAPRLRACAPDEIRTACGKGPYGAQRGAGPASIETAAASAIDIAVWDATARRAGLPLNEVLGRPVRDRACVYVTCCDPDDPSNPEDGNDGAYDYTLSKDDPKALARELRAEGFSTMKVWFLESVGDLPDTIRRLKAIREVEGICVAIDWMGLLPAEEGRRVARALDHLGLAWIEDPLPPCDPLCLGELAKELRTPVCAGESLAGREAFEALATQGRIAFLHVDVGWAGGVSAALEVANIAEHHRRGLLFHDCSGPISLATSLHIATLVDTDVRVEVVRPYLRTSYLRIAEGVPAVTAGSAAPAGPGHGCTHAPSFLAGCRRRSTALATR
jgi:galactonate dehydratase